MKILPTTGVEERHERATGSEIDHHALTHTTAARPTPKLLPHLHHELGRVSTSKIHLKRVQSIESVPPEPSFKKSINRANTTVRHIRSKSYT